MLKKIVVTFIIYLLAESFISLFGASVLNTIYKKDFSLELLMPDNINGTIVLFLIQILFLVLFFIKVNQIFFANKIFGKSLSIKPLLFLNGTLIGLLIVSLISTALVFVNLQTFTPNYQTGNSVYLIKGILFTLLISIKEEVIFRGFLLKTFSTSYGKLRSILITSILFSLLHFTSKDYNFYAFLEIFIASVFLCVAMYKKGNIWLPIGIHTGFNFFLFFIYNVEDANITSIPLFIGEILGDRHLIYSIEILLFLGVTIIFLFTPPKHTIKKFIRYSKIYWLNNKLSFNSNS